MAIRHRLTSEQLGKHHIYKRDAKIMPSRLKVVFNATIVGHMCMPLFLLGRLNLKLLIDFMDLAQTHGWP